MSSFFPPRWRDRLALLLACSLIATTALGWVGRSDFWVGSAFLTLRLPLLAVAVGLLALARLGRVAKVSVRLTAVAAAILLASWASDAVQKRSPATESDGKRLHVVTANLLYVNRHHARTIARLAKSGADVIALQEVTLAHERAIGPALRKRYPYQSWSPSRGAFGTAILSTSPLTDSSEFFDGEQRFAQCATLRTTTSVRICSVHLSSPAEAFPIRASPSFIRDLDAVAHARARQVTKLLRHVEQATAKKQHVVLAGDFNTLEIEPLHQLLERRLVDTYRATTWDIGATWPHASGAPDSSKPFARIDYIFASDALHVEKSRVLSPAGSDHAPLSTTLRLPR